MTTITSKYDMEKLLIISKDDILGSVAKWTVKQSPYPVPENLETVLNALNGIIAPLFPKNTPLQFLEMNGYDFMNMLKMWLEQIPEFVAYNNRKNGKEGNNWISRYSSDTDPDNDFIDLGALYRNVTHDIITEQI